MGVAGPSAGHPHLSRDDRARGQLARLEAQDEPVDGERPRAQLRLATAAHVERDRVPAGEQVARGVERGGVQPERGGQRGLAFALTLQQIFCPVGVHGA